MHRFLFLFGAAIVAGLGAIYLQPGTPGGAVVSNTYNDDRPNIYDLDNLPDLTALALPADQYDELSSVEVTRDLNGSSNADRIEAIVSFLNADQKEVQAELLAMHVVQPGDSLHNIAQRYYGDAEAAETIFLANRYTLTKSQYIKVGQSLQIPKMNGL